MEFCCGWVAGVAKVIAGHPFDTIKGRVQSGMYGDTPLQALRGTLTHEGVSALYKGVVWPCASVGLVSGVLFFVNGNVRRALQPDSSVPLTYAQMLAAGAAGGCAVGVIVTPFEVIKVNQQMNKSSAQQQQQKLTFKSALQQRGVRGLYTGFGPTLAREMITFGIFFPLNEYFLSIARARHSKNADHGADKQQQQQQKLPIPVRVVCAGVAGMLCWMPAYPVDQIKTAVTLAAFNRDGGSVSSIAAGQRLFAEGGIRRLYRGITPCVIRAFPAYSAQYITFETTLKYVRGTS